MSALRRIVFNRSVTLVKMQSGRGFSDSATVSQLTVPADVAQPTASFDVALAAAGMQTDLIVTMNRHLFNSDNFTHCIVDGITYRIKRENSVHKERLIRLSLIKNI